ncbi:hypothetical protein RhiirA4_488383 [Rhizophagus irregularis]|uniref:Uncharacterized protein n=1 Tax=Rhizophagus irregularis TaxID=588596 RepID=A0A2I1HTU8_9GLOM|nr:hypothetical protein RhiirA4_488383 [Rhizophagus irregularis]
MDVLEKVFRENFLKDAANNKPMGNFLRDSKLWDELDAWKERHNKLEESVKVLKEEKKFADEQIISLEKEKKIADKRIISLEKNIKKAEEQIISLENGVRKFKDLEKNKNNEIYKMLKKVGYIERLEVKWNYKYRTVRARIHLTKEMVEVFQKGGNIALTKNERIGCKV